MQLKITAYVIKCDSLLIKLKKIKALWVLKVKISSKHVFVRKQVSFTEVSYDDVDSGRLIY